MPVAPQSQSSSSSSSSLFSTIGSFLHPGRNNNPNPSAVAPSPSVNPTTQPQHLSDMLQLYAVFESNLAQRLSNLLPAEDSPCVNLAFLNQALEILLQTKSDLKLLTPSHRSGLSQSQIKAMDDFLERSSKILDVCRSVKDQIADIQSLQGTLNLITACLSPTPSKKNHGVFNLCNAQIRRARKALHALSLSMNIHSDEFQHSAFFRPARTLREHAVGEDSHQPQKWRSWHGHSRSGSGGSSTNSSSVSSSFPAKQLHAVSALLVPPRMSSSDVEESFCAAVYSVNVVSVFFLGVTLAALPGSPSIYIGNNAHPRSFMWASPLLHLQEKIHDELRRQVRKSNNYAGLWELDQISTIVKRVLDLIDNDDDDDAPLQEKPKEEIRNLVKQLQQILEELERDLSSLSGKVNNLYKQIMDTRMEILDSVSGIKSE